MPPVNNTNQLPDWVKGVMSPEQSQRASQLLNSIVGPMAMPQKKGGAQQTPTPNPNVPVATGSFNSRMDPAARAALLQTMMNRARGGPTTPTGGAPGV